MKRTLGFFLSLTFVAISCKKDKDQPSPNSTMQSTDYGKLAVGNYWIYERFKIDSLGVATSMNIYDSCYISKDTIINGKTFFEMYRPDLYGPFYSYLRDSSACILDNYGRIQFAPNDFSTIFRTTYPTASSTDTIAECLFKMNHKDSLINTPAGNFTTSDFQIAHNMYPAWTSFYSIRYSNTCYADNVGIIVETLKIIYTDPYSYERRLVRFQVN
jgi:hypothetical protein